MNLSIAQEFIRFRDIFFEEFARQKELNFTLREQIKFLLQEVKTLNSRLEEIEKIDHDKSINDWLEKMPEDHEGEIVDEDNF